jgi:hypothetical protein
MNTFTTRNAGHRHQSAQGFWAASGTVWSRRRNRQDQAIPRSAPSLVATVGRWP